MGESLLLLERLLGFSLLLILLLLVLRFIDFLVSKQSSSNLVPTNNKNPVFSEKAIIVRILKILLPRSEQENVIGDLMEDFSEFQSVLKANFWLHKQIIRSVLPLTARAIRNWFIGLGYWKIPSKQGVNSLLQHSTSINAKGRPFTAELQLELLEAIEFSFDKEGNWIPPTLVMNPIHADRVTAELKRFEIEANLRNRLEALIVRKRTNLR